MPSFQDLTGFRFGNSIVIEFAYRNKYAFWKCKCDCGTEFVSRSDALKSGATKSCGCFTKERMKILGKSNTKHGLSAGRSLSYSSWTEMRKRCYNKNHQAYHNYGGRGIKICDRWLESFENFYEDMGERPQGLTIERINNNGNYEKDNCKWATRTEQQQNKRPYSECRPMKRRSNKNADTARLSTTLG